MLRKDYIMRLYEEFGKFLGVVFGLRKANKWEELSELIKHSAQKYTGIEVEFVEAMETEGIIEKLLKEHHLTTENFKMLGDLLYEKALMYMATDRSEAATRTLQKVFLLFNHVKNDALDSDFSLDMHYKLKNTKELLGMDDKA